MCVCPGCAAGPQTDKGVPSRFASKCVFSEMWGQLYDFLFDPLSHTHLALSISVAEADIYVFHPGVCDVIHFKVPFWSVPRFCSARLKRFNISFIYAAGGLKVSDL